MYILSLNMKCFLLRWKRTLAFAGLAALLGALAGVLGNALLYGEKSLEPVAIVLVDEDDTFESRAFYTVLTGMESYSGFLLFEKADRAAALRKMSDGGAAAIFVIPQGFTESVKNGRNMPYQVIYNGVSPVKAALTRYFSDAFTAMLSASQAGVYAGLDYARENGTAQDYDAIFRKVNLKYLSLVGGREAMISRRDASATGGLDIFAYYALSACVFVAMAGVILYTGVFQANFGRAASLRLARMGTGAGTLFLANALSFSAMLACVFAALALPAFALAKAMGFAPHVSPEIVPAALLFALCAGCFGLLASLMFSDSFSTGVFVTVFSLISLFISGGIIPTAFFPGALAQAGKFTLNYWAVRLFAGCLSGRADWALAGPMVAWLVICGACAFVLTRRKTEAGARL